MRLISMVTAAVLALTATTSIAQDAVSGDIKQRQQEQGEINNGTNPTLLTTKFGLQYEGYSPRTGSNFGLAEMFVTVPFGETKNMALEFTLPFANSPLDDSHDLGDISAKFIHVLSVTPTNGMAYTAELFLDTASRADIGNGQPVLEMSGFYAFFLENGSIFAPAVVQTMGLGGTGFANDINTTTVDFYYVPKLPNPKFFMTLDPALVYDWTTDEGFASLQVTMGMLTGKLWGGDSQVFIKPGIYAGENRPIDFSLQVGFKLLNF
ncbi:hypothetical protein [Shimia biformata]|uniref:hypothetical protein n=1 Tax=Shimia biformata TaxID=1294299 RepID=UPI00195182DC|nr:hypothetical protein [Shimia biformata]